MYQANNPGNYAHVLTLAGFGHDVSEEDRDSDGKWTKGGGGTDTAGVESDYITHPKNLNGLEEGAIKQYSFEYSVNFALRGANGYGGKLPFYKTQIAFMDSAIAKSKLSADTTLYRGLKSYPGIEETMKPGAIVTDKAYQSTSFNEDDARYMGDHALFRIHAKAGQNALVLGNIVGDAEQHEVLLPRDSRYRILRVSTQKINGRTTKVIDAELLDPGT